MSRENRCWMLSTSIAHTPHCSIHVSSIHLLPSVSALTDRGALIFQSKENCNWKTKNNFFERNSINQLFSYTLATLLDRYPVASQSVSQQETNHVWWNRSHNWWGHNEMCCSHGCVILLPYPSMAISIFSLSSRRAEDDLIGIDDWMLGRGVATWIDPRNSWSVWWVQLLNLSRDRGGNLSNGYRLLEIIFGELYRVVT